MASNTAAVFLLQRMQSVTCCIILLITVNVTVSTWFVTGMSCNVMECSLDNCCIAQTVLQTLNLPLQISLCDKKEHTADVSALLDITALCPSATGYPNQGFNHYREPRRVPMLRLISLSFFIHERLEWTLQLQLLHLIMFYGSSDPGCREEMAEHGGPRP